MSTFTSAVVVPALIACSHPAPAPIDNVQPAPTVRVFEIRLERTVCFGRCPAYSVTIRGDGMVLWHGDSDVAALGDRTGRITRAQLTELLAAIDRAHFFDLQDDGAPPCKQPHGLCDITICSDTSHSLVKVTREGRTHEVDNAHCVDSPADELEDLIDKLAATDAWVGNL